MKINSFDQFDKRPATVNDKFFKGRDDNAKTKLTNVYFFLFSLPLIKSITVNFVTNFNTKYNTAAYPNKNA